MLKKAVNTLLFVLPAVFLITVISLFICRCVSSTRISLSAPRIYQAVQSVEDGKLNINTASAQQLELLPGIGPAISERIVAYRDENGPFKNVRELLNVKGIGEKTLEKIMDYITIGD